jgi:hypothetical protein
VNLEGLFDWIAARLRPEGVFLSFDTIGRNGHQMWPESKFYVDRFWTLLPERLRYDLVWKKVADTYLDWDCSSKGFEGIRAQDILPLLVERFEFEKFLGYGGLTDPFLGRRFAGNFDLDSEFDRGVLELLENTNDALLRSGALKPTRMAAVMRPKGTQVEQRTWGGLDAQRSVRDPEAEPVMAVLIPPPA